MSIANKKRKTAWLTCVDLLEVSVAMHDSIGPCMRVESLPYLTRKL